MISHLYLQQKKVVEGFVNSLGFISWCWFPLWTLAGSILTTLKSICVYFNCICSLFKFKLQSNLLIILIITI